MLRRAFLALSLSFAALPALAQDAPQPAASAPAVPAKPAGPRVLLKTNMGDITIELDMQHAQKTAENFLAYVKSGYYKGTIFHRVINGFMIQGGGYDKGLNGKPGLRAPIKSESSNGLKNETYAIAMARTNDPHSATSQFFINVNDNERLDYPGHDGWGYTVFGKVVAGTETVDKIKAVEVAPVGEHQHVPLKTVVVESATILK